MGNRNGPEFSIPRLVNVLGSSRYKHIENNKQAVGGRFKVQELPEIPIPIPIPIPGTWPVIDVTQVLDRPL